MHLEGKKVLVVSITFVILVSLIFTYLKFGKDKQSDTRVYTNEVVTESNGSLIAGFPDIPRYPGSTVRTTYKKVQTGKTDYVGVWRIKGNGIETLKWYKTELEKTGWKVTGPVVHESTEEMQILAENKTYKLRMMNTEENDDESMKIIIAEFLEK